jgi:hypothetical protein
LVRIAPDEEGAGGLDTAGDTHDNAEKGVRSTDRRKPGIIGWSRVPVFSDTDSDYTRDYVSREDADIPGYNVFTGIQS